MSLNYSKSFDVKVEKKAVNTSIDSLLNTTMSQSSYFKIYINRLYHPAMSSKTIFNGELMSFLPIKSVNFTTTSLEMTTIPVNIFGDMSIATRRKLGKLSVTLLDTNDCFYEKALKSWYDASVKNDGYVGYMEDIVSNMTYVSYSTEGTPQSTLNLEVMLTDDMVMARDYDSNELKTITFNLLVVGGS